MATTLNELDQRAMATCFTVVERKLALKTAREKSRQALKDLALALRAEREAKQALADYLNR